MLEGRKDNEYIVKDLKEVVPSHDAYLTQYEREDSSAEPVELMHTSLLFF